MGERVRLGLIPQQVDSPLVDYVAAYMLKMRADKQEAALYVLGDVAAAVVQMRFGLVTGHPRGERFIAKELGLKPGAVREALRDSVEKLIVTMDINVDEAFA